MRLPRQRRAVGEVDFHCPHLSRTKKQIVYLPVNWTETVGRGVLHKTPPLPESYNFRLQPAVPMILPLRVVKPAGKSINLDESVIKSAKIIRHAENFSDFVIVNRHGDRFCFLGRLYQIHENFRYFLNIQFF